MEGTGGEIEGKRGQGKEGEEVETLWSVVDDAF